MSAHLRYLLYVLRHKYHVLVAGCRLGVPLWRLIVHDWSKFTRAEWGPYVRRFYGGGGNDEEFRAAWLHHVQKNPHHWEHWCPWAVVQILNGRPATAQKMASERAAAIGLMSHGGSWTPPPFLMGAVAVKMPETYAREMVADWIGAGRAQGKDDLFNWWQENRDRMILHPETRDAASVLVNLVVWKKSKEVIKQSTRGAKRP